MSASDRRDWWWEYCHREYKPINWTVVGRVLSSLVDGVAKMSTATQPESVQLFEAALLLGVGFDATPDDVVRAALRRKMTEGRLHPDHGGDPETAKRYIAASNLLIAHARSRTS